MPTKLAGTKFTLGDDFRVDRSVVSLANPVSVRAFGAKGDGVTDDTEAIQAAINFCAAAGGRTVVTGNGTFKYSTLSISSSRIRFVADGAVLVRTSTTGDGMVVKSTGARIYGIEVLGGIWEQQGTASAGRAVYFENVGQSKFSGLISNGSGTPFQGLELYNVSQFTIGEGSAVQNCASHGIKISDCTDVYASNVRSDANAGDGWHLDTTNGTYVTGCTAWNNTGRAWLIDQTIVSPVNASAGMSYLFATGCVGDTSGGHNWSVRKLKRSKLSSCWGASQQATTVNKHGFYLDQCAGVELAACIGVSNNAVGLYIYQSSTQIKVTGGQYEGNGQVAGSDRREGIVIDSGCEVQMVNVDCLDSQAVKTQQFGLRVRPGVSRLIVSNCDFSGNASYPYAFDAVPTFFREENNYTAESMSVASASAVTLPMFGRVFTITGTTTIDTLSQQWAQRSVTLIFASTAVVGDAGSIKIAGSFSASADDTLSLTSDGTSWYETSRSAN